MEPKELTCDGVADLWDEMDWDECPVCGGIPDDYGVLVHATETIH